MTEISNLILDEPESVGSIQIPASVQRLLDDVRTDPVRLAKLAQEIEDEIDRRWNLMKPAGSANTNSE